MFRFSIQDLVSNALALEVGVQGLGMSLFARGILEIHSRI